MMLDAQKITLMWPEAALLRLPQVLELVGLRRSTVYALIARKKFPGQVKLSSRAVGWKVQEVLAWLDDPSGWPHVDENT